MYNRYIPQSDGSYRRQSTQEPFTRPQTPPPPPPPPECPPQEGSCESCPHRPQPREDRRPENPGFLRSLLPGNFDTEDLLVVVLLLLMCGEGKEDGNLPLLTLALYLML